MLGSNMLEIAIGMFFIYFVLSSICSALNEWLGALTASRARSLEAGIRSLLNDPKAQGLAKGLLDHPLVATLESPGVWSIPGLLSIWFRRFGRPTYISATTFVTALMDQIAPLGRDASPQQFSDVWNALQAKFKEQHDAKAAIDQKRTELTTQAAQLAAEAKVSRDSEKTKEAKRIQDQADQKQKRSVEAAQGIETLSALLAIAGRSPNDLAAFRKNLETWYDEGMERVAGWYKRKTQIMLLAIAAILSLVINADGVSFLLFLNQDSTARQSIATAARDFVQNPANDPRVTTAGQPPGGAGTAPGAAEAGMRDAQTRVQLLSSQLKSYSLPIGWDLTNFDSQRFWSSFATEGSPPVPTATSAPGGRGTAAQPATAAQFVAELRRLPSSRYEWFLKGLGLLFSTIAMSMGASFYFDLLKQVVNLRQTGVPPDEMPTR